VRRSTIVLFAAVLLAGLSEGLLGGSASAATPGPVQPYVAPPFAADCTVHRFGEGEAPDITAYPDDPLCVEYAKRDITVDNGGAVGFLLAEPARFAMAGPKCQYWQQDHWSVQLSRGDTPVVRWDGSYWFDKGRGQAAGRLSRVRVGGQPVSVRQAATVVEGASPELAAYLRRYARGGNGMGYDGTVPFDPRCS
jgi:hypothetical protein